MSKQRNHPVMTQAVRDCLRKEFSDFFFQMTTEEPGWPAITDAQLVDGIADALVVVGQRNKRGIAMIQTLVYELQDRVEQLKGK